MITARIYNEHGALNSGPILEAVRSGLLRTGFGLVPHGEQVPVIWSVLWSGRMMPNRQIYRSARAKGLPVMIIEVGNLARGRTWRISLDNVNSQGYFGEGPLDSQRPDRLAVGLEPPKSQRKAAILIASQHEKSLQWEGQRPMADWIADTVRNLRKHTDRNIVVRPHPRSRIAPGDFGQGVTISDPRKLVNTYDDFDIDYGYHCVINHNSGPCVQAAIAGTPVICDTTSLAYPVSDRIENVEQVQLPDRESWFLRLCHTEWTIEEISAGIPFSRLKSGIEMRLNR